jgi:CBS domain-containing protein
MIIGHVLSNKEKKVLITIKESDLIADAAKLLAENKIGALPVTRNSKEVRGILSERDIVKEIAIRGSDALSQKIGDVMTKSVSTCTSTDTLKSVIEKMNAGRFRHMPVLENGDMIGFISISDLVLAHLNEVEYENAAMRGSVTGIS